MCGIVGFIGKKDAKKYIIGGLEKLEYRGYDSAGIATLNNNLKVVKENGKLANLIKTLETNTIEGNIGIGHTRWATHGKPSKENSHPHLNNEGTIAVVHNGIIENFTELKNMLIKEGYSFHSQTDTEVVSNLLDYHNKGNILEALKLTLKEIRGSYALGIISNDCPDKLIAARKESPLIVGKSEDGNFIASDIPAILEHTRDVYLIDNEEIAVLTKDEIKIYDKELNEIEKEITHIEWDMDSATKAGYEHFMMKEIHEQADVIKKTYKSIVNDSYEMNFNNINLDYTKFNKIYIIACGTAYHAGLIGKHMLEKTLRKDVLIDVASEFRYKNPIIDKSTLVIIISQSGETLDTLEALKEAKRKNATTLAITNVVGSSITREADNTIYTLAGPEIAVASTKAYTTQVTVLYLLTYYLGLKLNTLTEKETKIKLIELEKITESITTTLEQDEDIKKCADKIKNQSDIFYLGRGIDYLTALEGALKSKEISYIHSEAFASGELKHGTIALIEKNTPIIINITQEELVEKSISNIKEVKARDAYVIAIAKENNTDINSVADKVFYIPNTNDDLTCFTTIIVHQLLAYYLSYLKGNDVDKPRNLAKSVTVE